MSSAPSERRGLGRGLEVLIGGAGGSELAHVPVEQIHPSPRQPRKRFDHEATAGLAESIRAQGIIQPVVLRPRPAGGYELIAGERRWRAAREAKLDTLPALIRDAADRDALLLGLVENVAREELSPIEEARAYAILADEFELSLGEIAERVGGSKPAVSNRLRLLELPDDILALVERGELTEGHARAVLAVPDNEGRRRLARKIVRRGLSVRAAEREARWSGAATKRRRRAPADPQLAERVRGAAERLTGFSARVTSRGLEIPVESEVQLEELAEVLEGLESAPNERPGGVGELMFGEWMEDLESLEAISQDAEARKIFLRMAAMSQEGRLGSFLVELAGTPELDEFTKGTLSEIARDEAFLLVVDDYLRRTTVLH